MWGYILWYNYSFSCSSKNKWVKLLILLNCETQMNQFIWRMALGFFILENSPLNFWILNQTECETLQVNEIRRSRFCWENRKMEIRKPLCYDIPIVESLLSWSTYFVSRLQGRMRKFTIWEVLVPVLGLWMSVRMEATISFQMETISGRQRVCETKKGKFT